MSDARNTKKTNSEIHQFSAVLLITVDTAFFGANVTSVFSASPLTWLGAFLFTGTGVFLVQKYLSEDDTLPAFTKGFVLGTMAGVPTPVAGILGGTLIIGKEGFKKLPDKNIKGTSKNKILNIALLVTFLTISFLVIKYAF